MLERPGRSWSTAACPLVAIATDVWERPRPSVAIAHLGQDTVEGLLRGGRTVEQVRDIHTEQANRGLPLVARADAIRTALLHVLELIRARIEDVRLTFVLGESISLEIHVHFIDEYGNSTQEHVRRERDRVRLEKPIAGELVGHRLDGRDLRGANAELVSARRHEQPPVIVEVNPEDATPASQRHDTERVADARFPLSPRHRVPRLRLVHWHSSERRQRTSFEIALNVSVPALPTRSKSTTSLEETHAPA